MNRSQLTSKPVETVESHTRSGRSVLRAAAGLLAGIVLLALPLDAQNSGGARSVDGVYRGTIGSQKIVVELRGPLDGGHGENYADPGDRQTYPIRGSYFYRRHGVSMELVGTPLGDGVVRLREYRKPGDAEFTAEWRLTMREGKATGIFCKCDLSRPGASTALPPQPGQTWPGQRTPAQQLKISLTRVSESLASDSDSHSDFDADRERYRSHSGDTYHDLLLDFPLQEGPEVQVSAEVAYKMRTDPRFKVGMPRLTRFPDARVMARINRDLDSNFVEDRLRAAEVLSTGHHSASLGGFYDQRTTLNFLLPHALSVLVESEWFSGGAHPNEGGYSKNYNLHTGKRFTIEAAFQTSPGNEAESAAILAKLYMRHYVKTAKKDTPPDTDCEEIVRKSTSDKDVPFNPLLYLSKEGLVIEPPLPHVVKACGPAVTVSYPELRQFIKGDTILRLLVDQQTSDKRKSGTVK